MEPVLSSEPGGPQGVNTSLQSAQRGLAAWPSRNWASLTRVGRWMPPRTCRAATRAMPRTWRPRSGLTRCRLWQGSEADKMAPRRSFACETKCHRRQCASSGCSSTSNTATMSGNESTLSRTRMTATSRHGALHNASRSAQTDKTGCVSVVSASSHGAETIA